MNSTLLERQTMKAEELEQMKQKIHRSTKDEMLNKFYMSGLSYMLQEELLEAWADTLKSEVPEFKFALREDLKDDLRFLPTKGEPNATGYDCRAAQLDRKDIVLRAGEYCMLPLGFRAICPNNWWFNLHPRSSSFLKRQMHSLIGIVDQDFPNQCHLLFQYIPDTKSLGHDLVIKFGDAVGQIVPVKRVEMIVSPITNDEYDRIVKERNAIRKGGFGSTGQ